VLNAAWTGVDLLSLWMIFLLT